MESIEELIYRLKDKSRRIRRQAEKELVKIGKPAVGLLIHTLEDENWRARWRDADALGKIGDARAIIPLRQRFGDDNVYVKIRVAGALGKIGKPAVQSLLRALENSDQEIREGAVMALGAVGDPMTVEPLIHCLKDDCEKVLREQCKPWHLLGMQGQ